LIDDETCLGSRIKEELSLDPAYYLVTNPHEDSVVLLAAALTGGSESEATGYQIAPRSASRPAWVILPSAPGPWISVGLAALVILPGTEVFADGIHSRHREEKPADLATRVTRGSDAEHFRVE
jgi:hypothetical protein